MVAISIHALQAESDALSNLSSITMSYFNPRSPSGERHVGALKASVTVYFNPRSPSGERLAFITRYYKNIHISIHALQAESDNVQVCAHKFKRDFNPRSPSGERLFVFAALPAVPFDFNPRSPSGERRDQ